MKLGEMAGISSSGSTTKMQPQIDLRSVWKLIDGSFLPVYIWFAAIDVSSL